MIKSFSKIFNSFSKEKIYSGKILKGVVISIDKDFVLVDSGLKSESYIPINEFIDKDNNLEVNIGDKVDVFLDSIEDGYGKTILSRKKAKIHQSWINLEKIYKNNLVVIGKIIEKVKGGFIVLIDNIRSFLPGSLIDFKSMNSDLEGKELDLKIIKLDKKNNNIVVSRKAIIEVENSYNKEEFLKSIEVNNIIKGIVKNITDYGAFIDLGFIDGLLHITDITWKRIKHPSEIVKLGEEIDVKILQFDKSNSKISLGLKQLTDDPWVEIYNKYPKYSKVTGKVTNLTDYGFFVEIDNGIEGLVHMSEIDWKNKNLHPSKIVKENDSIEVMILDININNRRISLGVKQCKDNPWKSFYLKYKVGDIVSGKIKSITDFGIFVELNEDGLDGLIHLSDVSWSINVKNDLNKYSKGDNISSIILQIDLLRYRISLGIKQLINDPLENYIKNNLKNNIVFGYVDSIKDNNIIIQLTDCILGNCMIDTKLINKNKLLIGNKYKFKITNYDKKLRIVNLELYDKDFLTKIENNILIENISNVMTEAFKSAKNK